MDATTINVVLLANVKFLFYDFEINSPANMVSYTQNTICGGNFLCKMAFAY